MAEVRFRNQDMTDREFLLAIWKAGGRDGVTSHDIALALGLSSNGKDKDKTPARRIGSRLAWMHRFGFLERINDAGASIPTGKGNPDDLWVLTPIGQTLMQGKLSKSIESTMTKMDPGSQLLLMRTLTRKTIVDGVQEVAKAMQREYQHQVAQRPR